MHPVDHIVANFAMRRGWLSQDTISACLRDLDHVAADARSPALLLVLKERGLVTNAQRKELESEQSRHIRLLDRIADIHRADAAIGQILLKQGLVPSNRLDECLYLQKSETQNGRIRRLADILVERGAIDRAAMAQALKGMNILKLECALCSKPAPLDETGPRELFVCAACGGVLLEESTMGALRREAPPKPPEVILAEKLSDRQCGKFVLVQHLGTGGMGAVWKAWDCELGRYVAIKFLRSTDDPVKHDEDVRRFLREAATAARLRHPNIVTVYETGQGRETHFIVMEYIEGKPLNQLRLPLRRCLEIMRDVAQAIHYAHENGIVHRDLKPSNIMLTPDGKAFVMDFGLARPMNADSHLTRSGYVLGTPMYMSPEQAMAVRDRREALSDVYSLGATLYDLLTGRPPFDAEEAWDVIADVLHKEPVPPCQRNPDIPRDVQTITLKAMHKKPNQRYASARELAEDLDRYLRGDPILARPTPWHERARHFARRHKMAAFASGIVLLAALSTAATLTVRSRAHERETRRRVARLVDDASKALARHRDLRAQRLKAVEALNALNDDVAAEMTQRTQEIQGLDLALVGEFHTAKTACEGALALVPHDADAERTLAEVLWDAFLYAEESEQPQDKVLYAVKDIESRPFAAARYRASMMKQARLTLATDPPGAEVIYRPYVQAPDGRLVPGEPRPLGTTPLDPAVDLPTGSGALTLRARGFVEATVPVLARRDEELKLGTIELFTADDIPPGFAYIPAGEFLMGGDPYAMRPHGKKRVRLPAFFMSRTEVTVEEYFEFLASIPREQAERHLPRTIQNQPYVFHRDSRQQPIAYITYSDAQAYCAWRSRRDGYAYRLPTAQEWEKAARGVDGRAFPWGNAFNASFTICALMQRDAPLAHPSNVASAEAAYDESPYGVRDMAGNVSEWCDAVLTIGTSGANTGREARGGAFIFETAAYFRCASRKSLTPDYRLGNVGFRLAASPTR